MTVEWSTATMTRFFPPGNATAVLHGNLCPSGAVIKVSAASSDLLRHRGRALVFDSIEAYSEVPDRPELDVAPDDALVLRNSGGRAQKMGPEGERATLPRHPSFVA